MTATRTALLWRAAVGVLAALVALAVAEIVALFVGAGSSPLFAVGSFVIDLAPPWLKDATIALFGTGDKAALLVALGLLVLALAVAAGLLDTARPPWGLVVLGAVGVAAAVIALTRSGSSPLWVMPSLVGALAGIRTLQAARRRLTAWREEGGRHSRRDFLRFAGIAAVASVAAGAVARSMNAASTAAAAARESIALPDAASVTAPIPAGASLDVDGITPLVTPNDGFYRIDTALQVPAVDAATWRLRVTGMVEREVEITLDELLAQPLTESTITIACVSNEVGGDLIGNATWLGWPVRELLARAKPLPGADMVLSRSVDGFTAGTPLEALTDERDSLLAVGMNGRPLPLQHGFPVRMIVPGLYGYVSATKWLAELKVTTFDADQGYWTPRGWDALGPVKTSSRIDVPRSGQSVSAGRVAVAGVAWAQHRGIEAVEVRIDDGEWMPARLALAISNDTWVQWVLDWDATPGSHTVAVRATDAEGDQQRSNRLPPAPNGSEGWHTVTVTVS
jgi:DMSO/TMAO reductase YedYZ molybdopterin-dependent catalytic subunit